MDRIRKSNLYLFIVSLTMSFASIAQCQTSDSTSLREGSWALQFGIAGNFTLTSFQGTTISAKYQLSARNAIRGGITISGSSSNGSSAFSATNADTSIGSASGSSHSSSQTISFVAQYLWYLNPTGPVHSYTALGPSVSYSFSRNNSDNPNSNGDYVYHYITSSSSTQHGAGITGSAGVEWFACQWLSIRAEYNESIQYQWGSNSSSTDYSSTFASYIPSHSGNSGTSKGWNLSSSSVGFGVSIYW
jgi:hypothetical protein